MFQAEGNAALSFPQCPLASNLISRRRNQSNLFSLLVATVHINSASPLRCPSAVRYLPLGSLNCNATHLLATSSCVTSFNCHAYQPHSLTATRGKSSKRNVQTCACPAIVAFHMLAKQGTTQPDRVPLGRWRIAKWRGNLDCRSGAYQSYFYSPSPHGARWYPFPSRWLSCLDQRHPQPIFFSRSHFCRFSEGKGNQINPSSPGR